MLEGLHEVRLRDLAVERVLETRVNLVDDVDAVVALIVESLELTESAIQLLLVLPVLFFEADGFKILMKVVGLVLLAHLLVSDALQKVPFKDNVVLDQVVAQRHFLDNCEHSMHILEFLEIVV